MRESVSSKESIMSISEKLPRFLKGSPFTINPVVSGKKIMFQYGTPNLLKEINLYHIHSAIYGSAIRNLFSLKGYETYADMGITDAGRQTGIYLRGFENLSEKNREKIRTIDDIYKLYYHTLLSSLDNERVECLSLKWQESLDENLCFQKLQKEAYQLALKRLQSDFNLLGVIFDYELSKIKCLHKNAEVSHRLKKLRVAFEDSGDLKAFPVMKNEGPILLRNSKGAYSQLYFELLFIYEYAANLSMQETVYVLCQKHEYQLRRANAILNKGGIKSEVRFIGIGDLSSSNKANIYSTFDTRYFVFSDVLGLLRNAYSKSHIKNTFHKILSDPHKEEKFLVQNYKFYILGQPRDKEFIYNFDKLFSLKDSNLLTLLIFLEKITRNISLEEDFSIIEDPDVEKHLNSFLKFQKKVNQAYRRFSFDALVRYIFQIIETYKVASEMISRYGEKYHTFHSKINEITANLIFEILKILNIDASWLLDTARPGLKVYEYKP